MKKIIQVHVSKGERYEVGDCVDLPVVTQGETLDELARNLREAISLHLEGRTGSHSKSFCPCQLESVL